MNEYKVILNNYDYLNIFKRRYKDMNRRSSGRTKRKYQSAQHGEIMLQIEFISWCYDTLDEFEKIWIEWEKNGFKKKYSPSVDRIDSDGTYTLNNIQWLSLSDNASKHDK